MTRERDGRGNNFCQSGLHWSDINLPHFLNVYKVDEFLELLELMNRTSYFFLYSNVLHRPLPYSIQVETGVMLVIVNSKQWLNGQPKQNRPTDKQEASAHPLLLRIFFCFSYSIPFLKRSTCLLKGQEGTLQNIVAISRPHPNFTQWIILFSLETV